MELTLILGWDDQTKQGTVACALDKAVPGAPDHPILCEKTFAADSLIEDPSYTTIKRELTFVLNQAREKRQRFLDAAGTLDEARVILEQPADCPVQPTPELWLVVRPGDGVVVGSHEDERDADKQIAASVLALKKVPYWTPPPVVDPEPEHEAWLLLTFDGVAVEWYDDEALANGAAAAADAIGQYLEVAWGPVPEGLAKGTWQPPVLKSAWLIVDRSAGQVGAYRFWFESEVDALLFLGSKDHTWSMVYGVVPEGLPVGEVPTMAKPVEWLVYDAFAEVVGRFENAADAVAMATEEGANTYGWNIEPRYEDDATNIPTIEWQLRDGGNVLVFNEFHVARIFALDNMTRFGPTAVYSPIFVQAEGV